MKKDDARRLSAKAQEQLRKQAVRLKSKGKSFVEIAEIVGVHRNTVSRWWSAYCDGGADTLKSRPRGLQKGLYRKLTPEQETLIQKLITGKTPDQFKLDFALWTREAVQSLVKSRLGIQLPIRTVGDYLKRWGFTPQKPLKRAYEQRPAEVKKWLDESYPIIEARAKKEKAEIHWGDETGIRSDCQHGRGYAPKGKTPVIRLSAKRASLNMISTVTHQGKVRFMLYEGSINAERFIQFIKQLIKGAKKKIFLVLDNLRVHHAKIVKKWLQDYNHRIALFFLPAYSPELNPDEYLNDDLKSGVHSKSPARDKESLTNKVRYHMKMLQKSPNRVQKYFKHSKISYTA